MDQEQQNQDASQPDVQPVVDASLPTDSSEQIAAPTEVGEPAADLMSQPETAPINPFATPSPSEPAASPFAAAPQIETVPPVFSTTPSPVPVAKKSHLGLIIGLIVGFVVLLAAVGIAGFIWFTNFYVSKADYQKAADTWNQLNTLDKDLASSASNVSTTSVSVTDFNAKVDQFSSKAQELGSLKAVQKDSTVKKAYDAFEVNIQKEVTMLHSTADFLTAADACKSVQTKAQLTSCTTGLRNVKSDGSPELKAYAAAMADYLDAAAQGKYVSYTSAQMAYEKSATALQSDVESSATAVRDAINAKLK